MSQSVHRASVNCRGVMSFTLANNGVLHLGGASQTTPTTALGALLASGIPQDGGKTRLAAIERGDVNGHAIKHAIVYLISTAGATVTKGAARHNAGEVASVLPSSTLGTRAAIGDQVELWNSAQGIFNFKLINLSGGNMEIDVEVYE